LLPAHFIITTKESNMTTSTTTIEAQIRLTPGQRERVGTVIEFERTVERFRAAVLAGDTEFVASMTDLVENMIGGVS
jgi:hypothetical protein